nr:uncharacterized protein LOC112429026 [Macaca nemestrina]
MGSAGRHYPAARASAAAASSQQPARAPVVRADTPPYADGPAPLRLSVARAGTFRATDEARGRRSASLLPLPRICRARSRRRCARSGAHHCCCSPQGWPGPGTARPRHAGARPPSSCSGRSGPAAPGTVCSGRSRAGAARARPRPPLPLPAPLPTYRAAGWGAGLAGVERPVHLPRGSRVLAGRCALWRARREVRPDQRGLASAPPGGRLQLLFESLSHVCGQCSYRDGGGGGNAGLGAIIWEDAVPCPAGAVVSPLKKPAPHCSPAAAAGSQGHLGVGSEGTAAPAPGCGARGAPRRLLVEGWPAVGAQEKPPYEPGSTALRPLSGRDSQWGPRRCRSRSAATRCQSDPSRCRPHSQPGVTQARISQSSSC